MRRSPRITAVLATALWLLAPALGAADDPSVTDERALRFVREARVVAMRSVGTGSNRSRQALLRLGRETRRAIWKTVGSDDPFRLSDGPDSYRHEVAAFEVDRLLGLGRVPATVERKVGQRTGSMQHWIEGAEEVRGPDPRNVDPRARPQIADIRLLRQLIGATADAGVLVSRSGELYTIDHARAFGPSARVDARSLRRVSRQAFESLEQMDTVAARRLLSRWLSVEEVDALLARRLEILRIVDERRRRQGDAAVFVP